MELGRNAESEDSTRKSLALDAGNGHAWNNLGVVLSRLGRARESCDAYEYALDCDPLNTGAMMNAAQPLCATGRFEQAAQLLGKALRLVPSKDTLRFNAGNAVGLMLQARALEPAEGLVRALIEADSHNSQAWHNLGVILAATDRGPEALRAVRQAIECEPDNSDSRLFLARLCAEAGRFDEASAELDRLMADPRHLSKALCFKAQVLAGRGRIREGISLLESHLHRYRGDDGAWFVLCHLAEAVGDLRKALRAAEASQSLLGRQGEHADPENVRWVHEKIRVLRRRLGS
jgi:tetratricopeptide (TPR) repeat protein